MLQDHTQVHGTHTYSTHTHTSYPSSHCGSHSRIPFPSKVTSDTARRPRHIFLQNISQVPSFPQVCPPICEVCECPIRPGILLLQFRKHFCIPGRVSLLVCLSEPLLPCLPHKSSKLRTLSPMAANLELLVSPGQAAQLLCRHSHWGQS